MIEKRDSVKIILLVTASVVLSLLLDWINPNKIKVVSYSFYFQIISALRIYFCGLLMDFCIVRLFKKDSVFILLLTLIPVVVYAFFILFHFRISCLNVFSRVFFCFTYLVLIFFCVWEIIFPTKDVLKLQNVLQLQFERLSAREKEVATLLVEGKTTNEIADKLFISIATVKTHIQSIYRKYDVRNKTEFAYKISKKM